MGWFNKSSSSSSETFNLNQNVGADNGAIALNASDGSVANVSINNTSLDGGAIKDAFKFAGDQSSSAYAFSTGIGQDAFNLVDHINTQAINTLSKTFEQSAADISAGASQLVDKVTLDSGQRVQQVVTVFGVIAVIMFGMSVYARRKS